MFFFHFGHLYLQRNKGLHSVGDCFPINETKGPKSGFTDSRCEIVDLSNDSIQEARSCNTLELETPC